MLVRQVEETLGRAHALFGDNAGVDAAPPADTDLAAATDIVRGGHIRMAAQTGAAPAAYLEAAAHAATALDVADRADRALRAGMYGAAHADRRGRAQTETVLRGAGSDAAALAPASGTASGQRALLAALHQRLGTQQRILDRYRWRGNQLAAMLRGLTYPPHHHSVGIPWHEAPFISGSTGRAARAGGPGSAAAAPLRSGSPRGLGLPGGTALGSLTRGSTPREVAAAILGEARRRGYSPQQAVAILADAIQESGLRPRAISPNGLWESIFQQDASYPGRHDPNLAIAAFFDRLATHGGPGTPDIWKAIFWLQQRPGEPSADAAYAHGRQGYLTEIMGQVGRAEALYREITGAT